MTPVSISIAIPIMIPIPSPDSTCGQMTIPHLVPLFTFKLYRTSAVFARSLSGCFFAQRSRSEWCNFQFSTWKRCGFGCLGFSQPRHENVRIAFLTAYYVDMYDTLSTFGWSTLCCPSSIFPLPSDYFAAVLQLLLSEVAV